jgi:hypothetical protein
MALDLHWEWRCFGAPSSAFAQRYCSLEGEKYESQTIKDTYLWVPRLDVNAKFREGAEDGLKFKRIKKQDGAIEQWYEKPAEIFNFPLERNAWDSLSLILSSVNIHLSSYPSMPPSRDVTLELLRKAGCKDIVVKKTRESKVWQTPSMRKVKIEWACISSPQACTSIGIESCYKDQSSTTRNDDPAKADILTAIKELLLDREQVKVAMNYIQAVEIWASGKNVAIE